MSRCTLERRATVRSRPRCTAAATSGTSPPFAATAVRALQRLPPTLLSGPTRTHPSSLSHQVQTLCDYTNTSHMFLASSKLALFYVIKQFEGLNSFWKLSSLLLTLQRPPTVFHTLPAPLGYLVFSIPPIRLNPSKNSGGTEQRGTTFYKKESCCRMYSVFYTSSNFLTYTVVTILLCAPQARRKGHVFCHWLMTRCTRKENS